MEVAPGDWNALLARLGLGDIYLTREYVESACLLEPGTPTFLQAADTVFPCILREFRDQVDVTTPYGYGGPVARGETAEVFYAAYENWCHERGVVSTFIRFHPLYANARYARLHTEPLGPTVAWQLQGTGLLERLHPHHRRVIRKAQAAGLEVTVSQNPRLEEFVALYERTMARVEADSFYLFSGAYWNSLRSLACLLVEARLAGELAASVLCFASNPWLHYHLGASSDAGRRLGASNLVLYEAACWGRAQGYTLLHLGGGVGGRRDSLFEFKRRFDPGAPEQEFVLGKQVHDEAAYRGLAAAEGRAPAGFFPAYRKRA